MKKTISLVLCICFCLAITSCNKENHSDSDTASITTEAPVETEEPTENKEIVLTTDNVLDYISVSDTYFAAKDYTDASILYGYWAKGYTAVGTSGRISGVQGYKYEDVSITLKIQYNYASYFPIVTFLEKDYITTTVKLNIGGNGEFSETHIPDWVSNEELESTYGEDNLILGKRYLTNVNYEGFKITEVSGAVIEQ